MGQSMEFFDSVEYTICVSLTLSAGDPHRYSVPLLGAVVGGEHR